MPAKHPSPVPALARAIWYAAKGEVEVREEPLASPQPGEVLVETLYSGVSRGTERLVLSGSISASEWQTMRAPLQAGAFPFPVKYGYCATGTVRAGATELIGRTVFVLHPHQDWFVAPQAMAVPVPDAVPPRRATLAANMETALNAVWDSGAGPADRIVVVGGGILGLLVAYLAGRLPGAKVTLVDVAEERRTVAEALGATFAKPADAPGGADVVFHTSVTPQGLATAIGCAGLEASVVELSWYGDALTPAPLGGAFHSRRLRLVSSQVGHVSHTRRARWDYRRRIEAALNLLADPTLNVLVADEIRFDECSARLPFVLASGAGGLAPVIAYA